MGGWLVVVVVGGFLVGVGEAVVTTRAVKEIISPLPYPNICRLDLNQAKALGEPTLPRPLPYPQGPGAKEREILFIYNFFYSTTNFQPDGNLPSSFIWALGQGKKPLIFVGFGKLGLSTSSQG